MLGIPNLPNPERVMAGFQKDIDGMRGELKAIRGLLEQLVAQGKTK